MRAGPILYMFSGSLTVTLGLNVHFLQCSMCTHRIGVEVDYRKKRMDLLAYTPVEYNYLEILAKCFVMLSRQNQFNQKVNFFTMLRIVRLVVQ